MNAYSYCGGNPIGFVDPDGNFIAPTFSINKNGLSVGFTCGWWGLGGRMNWNGEFATGPYAELGPRFGPGGIMGLTLQGGTMYGTKSGLYQQGSVGLDYNRTVGVGASTTYNYGRNQFSDIVVSGNIFGGMAGISYNTGNGNVNYSVAPPSVGFGPSGNFSVGASFSWGDDGRQFDVSGGYYPRDHASYSPWDNGELDKLMQDLKSDNGIKRTSSDAEWKTSKVPDKSQGKLMQVLNTYVPNSWWEVFVSMFNMHEGATWEKRLPGGFHYTVVEGRMTVHQDFYDVTIDPSKVILHNKTEVPKKKQ